MTAKLFVDDGNGHRPLMEISEETITYIGSDEYDMSGGNEMVKLSDFFEAKNSDDILDSVVASYVEHPDWLRRHLEEWGDIYNKANKGLPISFEVERSGMPAFCDTRHKVTYVLEKTCKIIDNPQRPIFKCCSICYNPMDGNENYCSKCGSKVVN